MTNVKRLIRPAGVSTAALTLLLAAGPLRGQVVNNDRDGVSVGARIITGVGVALDGADSIGARIVGALDLAANADGSLSYEQIDLIRQGLSTTAATQAGVVVGMTMVTPAGNGPASEGAPQAMRPVPDGLWRDPSRSYVYVTVCACNV